MSIVTKTGDRGDTGLFGGKRVPKDSARIQAYGAVDELNAVLGIVLSDPSLAPVARRQLLTIQNLLFRVGADLATPQDKQSKEERISDTNVAELELAVSDLENILPPQTSFLLPGGTPSSAFLHLARTICRRAERGTVTLKREEPINDIVLVFLNRLSDYLFLLARKMNIDAKVEEVKVTY